MRRPNAGVLHVLGRDISNGTELRAARARIGYLPARFSRAEHMTAGEFVEYAAYFKRTSAAAARAMVKRLDLTEAAGTELALLPPDVRLRAGLAAACVHEPELVLLDEPFGELCAAAEPWPTGAAGPGGDASAAINELIPVLRSLAPTVVITADGCDPLTGWCDRLFTLTRGKLTEQPTRSATTRRGRTAADRRWPDAAGVRDAVPGDHRRGGDPLPRRWLWPARPWSSRPWTGRPRRIGRRPPLPALPQPVRPRTRRTVARSAAGV
ncbi:ABC-type lipopolysaccharide export system ATPase subunit [Actinomadura algeriensis]|uniref:ABC-type lipopolysaccharide export system ATPase subunit n=1 Tax=Actinomadura algeriensis TaxID=1679523 RepID=A0ABR9JKJ5_9ACTN|nr:ABC-type lipopolysaccharide export system ATPase subunit [Actinomadura algeriensis]